MRSLRSFALVLVGVGALVATALAAPKDAAAPAEVPQELQTMVTTHCTGCHNETHVLNLKKLPAASDRATWASMLDEVQSGSMPPPKEDSITDRFPLDPSERADIVRMLEPLASVDHVPSARFISKGAWIKAATRLASGVLDAKQIGKLASPLKRNEPSAASRTRNLSAEQQLGFDRASVAVCEALAAAPPADGKASIVPAGATPAARDASIQMIEERLYGVALPVDIKRSADRYERFLAETKDPKQSSTMLCTLYMSGPRLIYGAYVRGNDE